MTTESRRVLVIDDDRDACGALGSVLRQARFEVLEISTAAEAREAFERFAPDVVLLDVNLDGGVSGLDVVESFPVSEELCETPVIFMSARSKDEATVSHALDRGGWDFLRRPFGRSELIARLNVAFRHRQARQELLAAAWTDPLTELPNRRAFEEGLERERRRAQRLRAPLSVTMMDLDHFKRINDAYGHGVGDRVLERVAELVRTQSRRTDLICRIGGEEFAVVLCDTGRAGATLFAENLREAIRSAGVPLRDAERLYFTASFGVATAKGPRLASAADAQRLVGLADAALYDAKRAGRDRVKGRELE